MNQELTGYPSIDKPWLKYHRSKPIREFNVNQKFYRLIEAANRENLDLDAIEFMGFSGNTWTYRELFSLTNQMADALSNAGVKQGDVVLVATVSGMDEALCLLAINKIGAISKWIDVTASSGEFKLAIEEDSCEVIVAFAIVIPELMKCLNKTRVKTVIYSSPNQFIKPFKIAKKSFPEFKELLNLKKDADPLPPMPKDRRFISFKSFLRTGNPNAQLKEVLYKKDTPVLIISSSGTTGKPKSIVHSDYTVNHSIKKQSVFDIPLFPGKVMYKIAPSWVGYGLINSLAVGLAYGMTVLLEPRIGDDMIFKYNNKYDIVYGVPLHYRYIADHFSEIKDMKRPAALISGGDKISAQEINDFQTLFATKGCSAQILNGAGNNEILGAGVVNFLCGNTPGTIGIPLGRDIVSIFDSDTGEELKYGQTGEICYQTESAFLEYANEPEKTKQVRRVHKDGKIWIHSGDLGSMDENGFVTIEGRLTRIITVDAFKISASHIEEVVEKHPAVKECVVIAVPDDEYGEVPMAHIVLRDDYSEQGGIQEEIQSLCVKHLKEKAVPKYYHFLNAIPYTSNNKQDYRELEQLGRELVKYGVMK